MGAVQIDKALVRQQSVTAFDPAMMLQAIDSSLLVAGAEILEILEVNPGALYSPIPPLLPAHQHQSNRRIVRGGNRIGKSWWGGKEAWWHAANQHPYRKVRHKSNVGLIVCSDWKSYRDDVSKVMWKLAPKHLIHPDSDYNASRGWKNEQIILRDPEFPDRHGHVILFRTSEQKPIAFAGITADWLWINEPPAQEIFTEALTRVADNMGPVWMTMTPINRPVDWLRLYVEGDKSKGILPVEYWEPFVIELKPENVPHRPRISVLTQIAGYPLEEYPQRVLGAWEGIIADRKLQGFTESCKRPCAGIVDIDIASGWKFGFGMDHGETAGRQVCILFAWHPTRQIVWAIDEYVSQKRTTPYEDALELVNMLLRWGLPLRRITDSKGDINSAGKGGAGESVNHQMGRYISAHYAVKEYEREKRMRFDEIAYRDQVELLAKQGGGVLPITAPEKSSEDNKKALQYMNTAFSSAGLFVDSTHCPVLTRSLAVWQGSNTDEAKHAVDGASYFLRSILAGFLTPSTYTTSAAFGGR